MLIFWIVWLLIGILLAAVLAGTALPFFRLKMQETLRPVRDRGVARFNLNNGISVLYEPECRLREYMHSYEVYRFNDRSVYFLGEWGRAVYSARYTLLCFDPAGRPFAFYRIRERQIDGKPHTRNIMLPCETAYVSFSLEYLNGKRIRRPLSPSPFYFMWLGLFLLSLAAVFDLLLLIAVRVARSVAALYLPDELTAFPSAGSIAATVTCLIVLVPLAVTGIAVYYKKLRESIPLLDRTLNKLKTIYDRTRAAVQQVAEKGSTVCFKFYCRLMNAFAPVRQAVAGLFARSPKQRGGG